MIDPCLLPDGRPARLLPLDRVRVRLRLREPVNFRFLHGGVLQGLLCRLFGHQLPPGLFPLALESGRVAYRAGAAYDFLLSAAGSSRALLAGLEAALGSVGRPRAEPPATLAGNFVVEEVAALPTRSLAAAIAKAQELAQQGRVRVVFPAPLRLRRPPELAQPGGAYLNAACFPAGVFLDRLWRRYHQLTFGEFPEGRELPPLPEGARAEVEHLVWLDLPVRGKLEGKPGRPSGTTLGGVCGSVVFAGLPLPWLLLLVLMEEGQLGSSTHYGFGAYSLEMAPDWLRPARTYAEELGARAEEPRRVAEVLSPAALALLDDGAAFFRRGLSRFSAIGGLRRAREQGIAARVGGAGTRFVADLRKEEVVARLAALWPGEPLVAKIGEWLEEPEKRAELAKLVGKVFGVELADALEEEGRRLVRVGSELRVFGREEALVA